MASKQITVFIAILSLVGASPSKDLADDADKFLLPWNIRPEHYDLTIYTNIEKFNILNEESFKFSGISEITFSVLYGDVDQVVLHTYDNVAITSANIVSLDLDGPLNYTVSIGSYEKETNKQTFQVSPALSNNGRYRITVYYTGYNTDALTGFYRSSYIDENNNRRWLLTTQFENFGARWAYPCLDEPEYKATYTLTLHYNQTLAEQGYSAFFNTEIESEQIRWLVTTDLEFFGARRAFPCLDEPEYKATVKLTMKFNESLAEDGYRAFFNAPVESEQIVNGVHVTTFKKTPLPLSTYLVAFIIAPFAKSPEPTYFDSSYNGENPLKPFYTIGQPKYFSPKRQDLLSQIAGPAALNLLTKLTVVGYGYDKVEQAGIPDFAAGAMENWGLVTYREGYVFWNNGTGTTGQKQGVATVVTHELAHQWFGDLVTLHWWTDLWLNEGFATFFEYLGTDQFRVEGLDTSDWDLVGQFVTDTIQRSAFITDGRRTSRPLTSEAYDPDVIETFGDNISYAKGGSVLRMFLHIMGEKLFYSGLNRYLSAQEEGVGTPEILLASWDGAADNLPAEERPNFGRRFASLLKGWHAQAGYPVVSVARTQDGRFNFTQKRFLSGNGDDSSRWNVPLSYSSDLEDNFNNTATTQFLYNDISSITFGLDVAGADWIVVNNQATGYYRVNYDSDNWDKLLDILNDPEQYEKIHVYNRAQILDDASALGASTHEDYLPYSRALNLLQTIRHDRSLAVWSTAVRVMRDLLLRVSVTSSLQDCTLLLKNYFLELVEPAFTELSLYVAESDPHTKKLLRSLVAEFACAINLPSCKQQALTLSQVHPDVRKVVLCEKVKQGDSKAWFDSRKEASGPQSPVQLDHLLALTCSRDEDRINQLLNDLTYGKFIASEFDTITVLEELFANHPSKSAAILNVLKSRSWRKVNDMKASDVMAKISPIASFYETSIHIETQSGVDEVQHLKTWADVKKPQICSFLLGRK